jgi:hypothetical protein
VEQFRHVIFAEGKLLAFNGLVQMQADVSIAQNFSISCEKLASTLTLMKDDDFSIGMTEHFLMLKRGKLRVRLRMIPTTGSALPMMPTPRKPLPSAPLWDGLRAVAPFASKDASRLWSVSALIKDGHLYATNNLSLVRYALPKEYAGIVAKIPAQALAFLLTLDPTKEARSFCCYDECLLFGSPGLLIRMPQAAGEWPDLTPFFEALPKRLPPVSADLKEAARCIAKFSDRFISVTDEQVGHKHTAIESEYEVSVKGGKGSYNAALFALVAECATHIDFTPFPKPVPFRTANVEGVMVGVRE